MESLEEGANHEESFDNPLLFMLIPGAAACLDESIREAGYIMIAGGLVPTVYNIAEKIYRKIKK